MVSGVRLPLGLPAGVSATGQITVTSPGAVIDFETRSSYRVLYQVTDSEDAA